MRDVSVTESDNLGSTDSEVKRILTLHLPISEYDTHGSDSDNDEVRRNQSASQELVSFRHRMSRGKSVFYSVFALYLYYNLF